MNKAPFVPMVVSLPSSLMPAQSSVDMASFRANRFEAALKSYMLSKGNAWSDGPGQSWLTDMLADAFHWCDVNGCDTDYVLKMARSYFESEKLEDVRRVSAGSYPVTHAAMKTTAPH